MSEKDKFLTRKVLRPGQPGTQKYMQEFGSDLICIRHRYNSKKRKKQITAEIVLEEKPWLTDTKRIPPNKIVGIKVTYQEKNIRKMIQDVGAKWDPVSRLWFLAYHHIESLGLEKRMIFLK